MFEFVHACMQTDPWLSLSKNYEIQRKNESDIINMKSGYWEKIEGKYISVCCFSWPRQILLVWSFTAKTVWIYLVSMQSGRSDERERSENKKSKIYLAIYFFSQFHSLGNLRQILLAWRVEKEVIGSGVRTRRVKYICIYNSIQLHSQNKSDTDLVSMKSRKSGERKKIEERRSNIFIYIISAGLTAQEI